MTRQETVIKITKITRIVGEMKSQLDLDDEIEFEALDSSWMNIGKWAEEICQYMEQAPLLFWPTLSQTTNLLPRW